MAWVSCHTVRAHCVGVGVGPPAGGAHTGGPGHGAVVAMARASSFVRSSRHAEHDAHYVRHPTGEVTVLKSDRAKALDAEFAGVLADCVAAGGFEGKKVSPGPLGLGGRAGRGREGCSAGLLVAAMGWPRCEC